MTQSIPAAAVTASDPQSRRQARLAAVQALYQLALGETTAEQLIREFRRNPQALLDDSHPPGHHPPIDDAAKADQSLFASIVTKVASDSAQLDEMIKGAIDPRFSAERLEVLLRAILRAGACELHQHGQTATGIIINDYVDITHAFFNAKEPGLVNAILDKLAKNLRS